MVWNLVNQRRHHNAVIRNALAGNLVSEFGSLQALAAPDGAAPEDKREPLEPPPDLVAKADASEAAQFAASGAVPALKLLASRRWRQPPTPSSICPHQSARRRLPKVRRRVEGGQVRDPALLEPGRGRGNRQVGVGPGFIKAGRVLQKIKALRRGADVVERGARIIPDVRGGARRRRGPCIRFRARLRRAAQRRKISVDRSNARRRARRRRLRRRRRRTKAPRGWQCVAQSLSCAGRDSRLRDR